MVPAEVPIIPADPLVAPEVGAVFVTSLAGVLDLVDYSSSDSDPSEDSLPPAPELPLVSPFLCSDDSEANSESEPAEQRPERHESLTSLDVMVLRWRDRVASRPSSPSGSSSHDTFAPSSEFSVAPIVAPLGILGPCKLLTGRKRVGPFPACRLSWRRVSHRLSDRHSSPDFTLDSSSSGSFSDSSLDTFSGSPSDLLSDTSSVHSSGCDASVSSSTPVSRSIDPTHVDLLPPRKRFRYSYSPEDSKEEHIEIGTADAETVTDLGIGDGVNNEDGIGMGVEIVASDIREDEKEFKAEASAGGTMEMAVHPLVTGGIFESTRGDAHDLEETGQLMASGERAGSTDMIKRLGWENLRVQALLCIERDQVDRPRHHMALSQEEFRQIRTDRDDAQRRLRRLESFDMTITRFRMTPEAIRRLNYPGEGLRGPLDTNYEATRAANALEAESQSQNGNDGGNVPISSARGYTYQDFIKCQPLNFKGTKGVLGLTRWFEKMETAFYISNCPEVYQVNDDGSVLSKEVIQQMETGTMGNFECEDTRNLVLILKKISRVDLVVY
ncbi:hypothetical protein Tco_0915280 [Tanacetum coccineum]